LPVAGARALFVPAMADGIDAQGRAFGRHVVGVPPSEELLGRYRAACAKLFPEPPDAVDAALLAFAARHPWSVGPLDAATALLRPASALRARILVMAAVLETTPQFADAFLPRPCGRLALVGRLAVIGARAVARGMVGVGLYGVVRARA
jgi:hypothetical protein